MHTLSMRPVYAVHSLQTRYSFSKIWTKVGRITTHN